MENKPKTILTIFTKLLPKGITLDSTTNLDTLKSKDRITFEIDTRIISYSKAREYFRENKQQLQEYFKIDYVPVYFFDERSHCKKQKYIKLIALIYKGE